MNKRSIIMLFLTLAFGMVQAQSETYQIETLTKPEKLLPTVSSNMLYQNIDKDFVKLSVSDNLVDLGTHPVIVGYLKAYQNHYPITISPDIAWLLICQGFSNHVNSNPEKIRSQILSFEGKKMLTVQRNVSDLNNMANFPWETIFPEFAKQISEYTGKPLINNLTSNFTTTTPTTQIASQITIMESMKEFFNYKVTFIGCGISEITVEGSVKDWQQILKRLDYLAQFDLKWWTSELKPVIQKIIDTKKGKLDKQFWMNMVKYHKLGVYGAHDGIDGWLLKFYPYLQAPATAENKAVAPLNFQRSAFKEIKSVNVLPKELANVPFLLEIKDSSGILTQSYRMEFWAGFMGLKQDQQSFNVKPEIGWAINRKSENVVK